MDREQERQGGWWTQFFVRAGIPSKIAQIYSKTMVVNRMDHSMLPDLSKEVLNELGIKAVGDVISIMRHAKKMHEEGNNSIMPELVESSVKESELKSSSTALTTVPAKKAKIGNVANTGGTTVQPRLPTTELPKPDQLPPASQTLQKQPQTKSPKTVKPIVATPDSTDQTALKTKSILSRLGDHRSKLVAATTTTATSPRSSLLLQGRLQPKEHTSTEVSSTTTTDQHVCVPMSTSAKVHTAIIHIPTSHNTITAASSSTSGCQAVNLKRTRQRSPEFTVTLDNDPRSPASSTTPISSSSLATRKTAKMHPNVTMPPSRTSASASVRTQDIRTRLGTTATTTTTGRNLRLKANDLGDSVFDRLG